MQLEPLDSDSDAEADLALPPEAVELPSKVPESSNLRLLGQPKLSAGCLVVEGQPGEKAFDVQTLTCLASREVVGIIVDIFGSIDSPWYVIMPRDDLAWCSGLEVYAVMTGANFVNPDDLLSESDSDASEAEEIAAVSDTPGLTEKGGDASDGGDKGPPSKGPPSKGDKGPPSRGKAGGPLGKDEGAT